MPFPVKLRQKIFMVKSENPNISDAEAFKKAMQMQSAANNQPTVPTEEEMKKKSAWTGVK